MPPNEKPLATMRRPRVDMAAVEAIGSRWEQRAPVSTSVQTSEREDVLTSKPSTLASVTTAVPAQVHAPIVPPVPKLPSDGPAQSAPVTVAPVASVAMSTNEVEPSSSSRAIVARVGRQLADGSRRGAKTLRRMTVYLEPARASQLAVRCAQTGETMSDVIDRALTAYLAD